MGKLKREENVMTQFGAVKKSVKRLCLADIKFGNLSYPSKFNFLNGFISASKFAIQEFALANSHLLNLASVES